VSWTRQLAPIATYSQAGAQFGHALTWTMLLTLRSMNSNHQRVYRLGTRGQASRTTSRANAKIGSYVLVDRS
jgi:Mn2+/Fe2+ NRAMP family transporter